MAKYFKARSKLSSMMMLMGLGLSIARPSTFVRDASVPQFNFTKCPAYYELQSDAVKANFTLEAFAGDYFELAFHDWTQYPPCPKPTCIQSQKVINTSVTPTKIEDHWSLECFGGRYRPLLEFNVTENKGHFIGFTKLIPGTLFPDTVVDFQYNYTSKSYDWVIEFQCVQKFDHVFFAGINFYVRKNQIPQVEFDAMLNRGRARGLGVYMDHGLGLYNVSQTDCHYDPPTTK